MHVVYEMSGNVNISRQSRAKYAQDTALIVNSQFQNRAAMREFLDHAHYHALFANSADEAVELCRNYEGPIHLLVAGDQLPGASGWDLAEAASKIRPGLIVLFLSWEAMFRGAPAANKTGASVGTVGKPFLARMLLEVTQALASRAQDGTRRN